MTDSVWNMAAFSAAAKGDLASAVVASTPGGIEAQEAAGQRALAREFTSLPINMDREIAAKFGFEFKDAIDELFVSVTAPASWSIVPTEHSMHSDIVDDQGRKRGSIFYKAAFYDRRANGHWSPRYRVERDYVDHELVAFNAVDTATGDTIFRQAVPDGSDSDKYKRQDSMEILVCDWLTKRFPDYRDPAAYW